MGGGYGQDVGYSNKVDAYDTSLVKTIPTALSQARTHLAATSLDGYALFGGGYYNGSNDVRNEVDVYDTSLVRTIPTPLSQGRRDLAATSLGSYALFGGGYNQNVYRGIVDVYQVA